MNITLSIDERIAEKAREKLRAVGKSLNQEIREHFQRIAGEENDQLQKDIEFLKSSAGLGNSDSSKWSRKDAYEERSQWLG